MFNSRIVSCLLMGALPVLFSTSAQAVDYIPASVCSSGISNNLGHMTNPSGSPVTWRCTAAVGSYGSNLDVDVTYIDDALNGNVTCVARSTREDGWVVHTTNQGTSSGPGSSTRGVMTLQGTGNTGGHTPRYVTIECTIPARETRGGNPHDSGLIGFRIY